MEDLLTDLTVEDFERYRGDVFRVAIDPSPLDFTLADIERRGFSGPGGRPSFRLLFRGPRTPLLPQATYRFAHPHFQALEMFIVPIGPDDDAMQYEALFS